MDNKIFISIRGNLYDYQHSLYKKRKDYMFWDLYNIITCRLMYTKYHEDVELLSERLRTYK